MTASVYIKIHTHTQTKRRTGRSSDQVPHFFHEGHVQLDLRNLGGRVWRAHRPQLQQSITDGQNVFS